MIEFDFFVDFQKNDFDFSFRRISMDPANKDINISNE